MKIVLSNFGTHIQMFTQCSTIFKLILNSFSVIVYAIEQQKMLHVELGKPLKKIILISTFVDIRFTPAPPLNFDE